MLPEVRVSAATVSHPNSCASPNNLFPQRCIPWQVFCFPEEESFCVHAYLITLHNGATNV